MSPLADVSNGDQEPRALSSEHGGFLVVSLTPIEQLLLQENSKLRKM